MSYNFNNLSGKLVKTAQSLGKGIKPPKEAGEIIYQSGVKFPKISSEMVTAGSGGEYGRVPAKLLAKYRHFQQDNGVPIHLKGGTGDKVLYYSTLALAAVGLAQCAQFYYVMSFPQPPSDD